MINGDVRLAKTGPATVIAGQAIAYTITVTNDGPSDATGVSVADPTPAGLVFVSNTGDCAAAFPCALGTLVPGATRTITATYQVPPGYTAPDPIVNTATVSATSGDANPANNTATATTSLVIDADVRVAKSGPSTVVAGQTVSYTIAVTNDGPSFGHGRIAVGSNAPRG